MILIKAELPYGNKNRSFARLIKDFLNSLLYINENTALEVDSNDLFKLNNVIVTLD